MTRYLDPTNDFTFKRVFCDKNRLINFLNAIMKLPEGFRIVDLRYISQEEVPELGHRKSGLLDIKCRDESDNVFIVEMQNGYEKHLLKRLQFYSSNAYVSQLRRGDSYGDLDPVFVIVILRDQIISPEIPIISYHKILEVSTGEHILKDIAHVLVELAKFTKSEEELQNEEDQWLYFLSRWSVAKDPPKTLKDPLILEAYQQIEEFRLSEDEYKLYLDAKTLAEKEAANLELKYNKGMQEGMKKGMQKGRAEGMQEGMQKGREEGIQEGMQKGREEGMQKGREEGMQKGREEGMQKGREEGIQEGMQKGMQKGRVEGMQEGMQKGKQEAVFEMAKNLIKQGVSLDMIAKATGLKKEEIAGLA